MDRHLRLPKNGRAGKLEEQSRAETFRDLRSHCTNNEEQARQQRRAEKERVDTFWAIFFLDRVVSSGTGRPVSLRDKDIEISFPSSDEIEDAEEWPAPFPALIRIIHLYGRIANLLNNIREVHQVTAEMLKHLVAAEDDLIGDTIPIPASKNEFRLTIERHLSATFAKAPLQRR